MLLYMPSNLPRAPSERFDARRLHWMCGPCRQIALLVRLAEQPHPEAAPILDGLRSGEGTQSARHSDRAVQKSHLQELVSPIELVQKRKDVVKLHEWM